ncbi:MAG TPA: hypothetical protein VND97_09670 [Beijerinckiaceae bacterium]|nr:hypothetical protein [Beijerinckiaceae bacterium]
MAKYDPLFDHLRRRRLATYEMSFREIEGLLHTFLPKSAARAEWWGNETASDARHVQCRAWLAAGYNAVLIKGAERVRFDRR